MPVKLILEKPREGGDSLADFIVRTQGKNLGRCDASNVHSKRAELLNSLSIDAEAEEAA